MLRRLALACVALLVVLPASRAVTCESFKEASRCKNTVTDAGICGWNTTASKCVVKDPLPIGLVGITALGRPQVVGVPADPAPFAVSQGE
jgi:hypothetical protein